MLKYILLTSIILFFTACSGDDRGAVNTLSIASSSTSNKCNTKNFSSINSPQSIPMLVVLINYNNERILGSLDTWGNKLFGNSEGQLNHYYQEISNTKFSFSQATECKGLASVTLNKNHPDTNIDSGSFEANVHPDLANALIALDAKIAFNAYDTDGDGHIQPDELLITFILAGYEDAYEGKHVTNGIWAHQYCLSNNIPTLDGVTLMGCSNKGNYAIFGATHRDHDATIGVIAHELGHSAFGLPDLYDTSGGSGGIGYFGLMGSGAWTYKNNSEYAGQTPIHMTAWSKYFNSWVTPAETTGAKTMLESSSNSYNVVKVANGATYYLLENRNNSGYDRGLFALNGTFNGGLAIWEIDETIINANLSSNKVNNGSSRGVDLIEASGTAGKDEANLFYDPNDTVHDNISNISTRGSTMTLNVN